MIAAPRRPAWDVLWKTGEEWRAAAKALARQDRAGAPAMRERLHRNGAVQHDGWGEGLRRDAPTLSRPNTHDKLLIHVHGGCLVLSPGRGGDDRGESGMAGIGQLQSDLGRLP